MTEETEISRISRLAEAVRKARGEDYSLRIETSGKNDELDMLADEIRQMVECLKEQGDGRKAAKDAAGEEHRYEERYCKHLQDCMFRHGCILLMAASNSHGTFSIRYEDETSSTIVRSSRAARSHGRGEPYNRTYPQDDCKKYASSVRGTVRDNTYIMERNMRHIGNGEVPVLPDDPYVPCGKQAMVIFI